LAPTDLRPESELTEAAVALRFESVCGGHVLRGEGDDRTIVGEEGLGTLLEFRGNGRMVSLLFFDWSAPNRSLFPFWGCSGFYS
ncbi:MAG: hypothetical protein ABIV50_01500, partial [Opitutus sp.]